MDSVAALPEPSSVDLSEVTSLTAAGHATFRNILPKAQIDRLRAVVEDQLKVHGHCRFGGRLGVRGLHLHPEIALLLENESVLNVLESCAFPEAPLLTGACDVMMDTTSSWHKDISADMNLGDDIYEDASFRVYKMAIYLQDQKAGSRQVLRVRPGSHRQRNGASLPEVDLATQAGDVLVFDVRTDHVGLRATLPERLLRRALTSLARFTGTDAEVQYAWLRRAFHRGVRRQKGRMALFLTFGPSGAAVHRYERACAGWNGPLPSPLDPRTACALEARGIGVIASA